MVISAKEEPEADLSPTMVAVMRLSKLLIGLPEGDERDINSSGSAATVAFYTLRLLVAYPQECYLIGTKGSTIKSIKKSSGAAPQSRLCQEVAQATLEIPLMTAYDIIGANGSNISYIRSSSGAIITLHESMGSPDEFTIMIRGTPSQVQVAQQLIQVALPDVTGYQNYEDRAATGCGCSYLISFD